MKLLGWGEVNGFGVPSAAPYTASDRSGTVTGVWTGGYVAFGLTGPTDGVQVDVRWVFFPDGGSRVDNPGFILDAGYPEYGEAYIPDTPGIHYIVASSAVDPDFSELTFVVDSEGGASWGEYQPNLVPPEPEPISPTLQIAWGQPYYPGGPPSTAPYIAGTHGSTDSAVFVHETYSIGLTESPVDRTVRIVHMYAPAGGSPEYYIDTYSLYLGNTSVGFSIREGERDGIHTFTASVDYSPMAVRLVFAATPDNDPAQDWYGSSAWYEEAAALPVFWTRFINAKEVIV